MYWPPFQAKKKSARSLPNLENECQWSVNDFGLAGWLIKATDSR
jgi:hypothetical protein